MRRWRNRLAQMSYTHEVGGSSPSRRTNLITSRSSLMVRCKAHNLETEDACSGSIPETATKPVQNKDKWSLRYYMKVLL